MDATITFRRAQTIPRMPRGKREAVSPVGVVRHEPAARRPPHQWAQQRPALDLGKPLEITNEAAFSSSHRIAAPALRAGAWPCNNASSVAMFSAARPSRS